MKYLSRDTSIETVRRLFSAKPDEDVVSVQDAFFAVGRDIEKIKENKDWLSNKLTHLKYHNLVKPVYSFKSGYRTLEKIQLTLEGKKALGRFEEDHVNNDMSTLTINSNGSSPSFTNLMKIVAKLRKENPDYEITFDVRLKRE